MIGEEIRNCGEVRKEKGEKIRIRNGTYGEISSCFVRSQKLILVSSERSSSQLSKPSEITISNPRFQIFFQWSNQSFCLRFWGKDSGRTRTIQTRLVVDPDRGSVREGKGVEVGTIGGSVFLQQSQSVFSQIQRGRIELWAMVFPRNWTVMGRRVTCRSRTADEPGMGVYELRLPPSMRL
ncbi:unnamed protein product [Microthlaspi erraticum]|uniref:Uncharacterized protein n=1 Tax=Microthlaspi erraticum TaxID=1685480 RepID=A0A6D2HHW0_9BRAS|nr:unnamed protein product [Microthlaspi erraticum]CAA7036261.1 unnamed protein product [Microthlaspi erraticum]